MIINKDNLSKRLVDCTRIGDFTWRVSDCEELSGSLLGGCLTCEELVGVTHRGGWGWIFSD
ncbi:MAG TPA: hypothetical protein EYQ48_00595 [Candidatus Lambdaproteobacteria bacterium]|nr:hypothetical protein [Candidatus Lambdaproteobacteria bacterium]